MMGKNINFKLVSLNVRGIRSFEKRKAVLNWLYKSQADICFLQETYSTPEVVNICATLDSKLREFQYKILNNIVFTNDKLFRFGLSHSPNCTFCNEDQNP